jgi:DNA-binding protein Fis
LLVAAELFSISRSAAPLLSGDSDGAIVVSQLRWVPLLLSICLGLVAFGVTSLLRALSAKITAHANEPELTTTGLRGDLALQQRERELAQLSPDGLPMLKEAEHILISEALRRTDGNQGIAAGMLGLTRQALNKRLIRNRQSGVDKGNAGASLPPELFRPRELYRQR